VSAALLVVLPLLAGATVQRTAGLGLALVAAPFVVAVLGARDGVSFGNALQCVLCLVVLARTGRRARWRSAALLLAGAAVGVPLGALVVARLPEGRLLVLLGALAVAAVGLSVFPRAGMLLRGPAGGVGAGAVAGFVNATAGVGGPMVSAYATTQRWEREVFVPTAQVVLLTINAAALAVKGVPDLPPVVWIVGLAAVGVGAVVGDLVAPRIAVATGRRLVVVVALLGGMATLVRGLAELCLLWAAESASSGSPVRRRAWCRGPGSVLGIVNIDISGRYVAIPIVLLMVWGWSRTWSMRCATSAREIDIPRRRFWSCAVR